MVSANSLTTLDKNEKSVFSDIFLRYARGCDSVSVLIAVPFLRTLTASEEWVREVWEYCDQEQTLRLSYGLFLLACKLCPTEKHQVRLKSDECRAMRREYRQIMFPVELKNGQVEESYDLRGSLGWRSDIANLALSCLSDLWDPLARASARVLRELSYNVCNHAFIRMHSCPKQIVDQIFGSQLKSIKLDLVQALCCLTAAYPDWANEYASNLLLHSLDSPYDCQTTALLIATVGNLACDPGTSVILAKILDNGKISDKLLSIFARTSNDELMTDILRLLYNLISMNGLDKLQAVHDQILMELLNGNQPTQSVTLLKYTLEVVNLQCGDSARLNSLVTDFRIVEYFQCKLKSELKYEEPVGPRLSLFLARIAQVPLLRSSFVAQGGIILSYNLFWSCPLDEIVRLNSILVLSNLLQSRDIVEVVASANQAQYYRIILQILEFETHIELVTRALDLWRTLLELSDEWKKGIQVIATLLRSPDLEVKVKALTLLDLLSSDADERLAFCCLSDESSSGNSSNIRYLCEMLVDTGQTPKTGGLTEVLLDKVKVTLVRVISKYTSDPCELVQKVLRNCRVGPLLYKCISTASPELQSTLVDAISPLFFFDVSACRSLIMATEAIGLKPIVEFLVEHADINRHCRLALEAIATHAYELSYLGRYARDIVMKLRNCSGEDVRPASRLIKFICTEWEGISNFPFNDVFEELFLWLNHESTDVVINCLDAIIELLRCDDATWREGIICPSRMHAIISAYSHAHDPPPEILQKVLGILWNVVERYHVDPTFIAASAPLHIGAILKRAIQDGKCAWLGLSVRFAEIEWVRVMLATDVAVVKRCMTALDSRCISDAASCLRHFNPAQSAKIALSSWWVRFFANIVHSVARCPQSGSGMIALTAFERLPIAELGEMNPAFLNVHQLSLLKAFGTIITSDISRIKVAPTSRNRTLTFARENERSAAKFGINPISECLNRICMQLNT